MQIRLIGLMVLAVVIGQVEGARKGLSSAKATPADQRVWQNPGRVEAKDFVGGVGGRSGVPRPPFRFIEEDVTGSTPKAKVRDARGRVWSVKWGEEVHSDTFASRLVWAVGYTVEPTYYVATGQLLGVPHGSLKRIKRYVSPAGEFRGARFQLRSQTDKFVAGKSWTWENNPFLGTRELDGLRIMVMLTSNWDNKDARDVDRDSNTGIFQHVAGHRTSFLYFIPDWGASMGRWGHTATRSKWDCIGYDDETRHFVKGVKHGFVEWGYSGQHTGDATREIPVAHVQWLMQYLGRVTDRQILAGLQTSGATEGEQRCYAMCVRRRIEQLQSLR